MDKKARVNALRRFSCAALFAAVVISQAAAQSIAPTHRYSFTNAPGTATNGAVVADSIAGADGAVRGGGASFTGSRVSLPGGSSAIAPYIDLPNGLLSANSTNNGGTGQFSVEAWLRLTGVRNWSRIFDFGSSGAGEVGGPGGGGEGMDYLMWSASIDVNGTAQRVELRNHDAVGGGGDVGNFTEDHPVATRTPTDVHVALTWDETTGQVRVYENGVEVDAPTTVAPMSAINDVNVWLGRSNWSGDDNAQGEFDEVRFYNRVLSGPEVLSSLAAGPETVISANPVQITLEPPSAITVPENGNLSLVAGASGQFPISFQWYLNGTPYSGATSNAALVPSVPFAANGSQVYLVASNNISDTAYTATTRVVTVTVIADTNAPTIQRVQQVASNQVEVVFSEPVSATDAANASLFTVTGLTGALTVSAAQAGADASRVLLTIAEPFADCTYYTVTANGVHDVSAAANVTTAGTTGAFWHLAPASLVHRYTFNTPVAADATGATIPDLVASSNGVVLSGGGASALSGDKLALSGGGSATSPYVDLPNGLLSINSTNNGGSGQVSFEGWVRVVGNHVWSRILDFGSSGPCCLTGAEVTGPGGGGDGIDYLMYSAQAGGNTSRREVFITNRDQTDHGTVGLQYSINSFDREFHFVITWDEATGRFITYENGVVVANLTTVAALNEINDVNVWLGRSNWSGDENAQAEYNEFRVYNRVLSAEDVRRDLLAGPDDNYGTPLGLEIAITNRSMFTNSVRSLPVLVNFSNVGTQNVATLGCVVFESSAPEVATVNSNGVLQTFGTGSATITATFAGLSNSIVINVSEDNVAPTVVSVRPNGTRYVEVVFSEPVDPGTGGELFSYTVSGPSGPINIQAVRILSDPSHVLLTLETDMPCEPITVVVEGVTDIVGNPVEPGTSESFFNYVPQGLTHRYSFNGTNATAQDAIVVDGVGTADGVIRGSGAQLLGNRVSLPGGSSGTAAYVDLPNGLLSTNSTNNAGSGQLTLEGWVKVTGVHAWSRIFDFGDSAGAEVPGPGGGGEGLDYLMLSAMNGTDPNTRRTELRNNNPTGGGIFTVDHQTTTLNQDIHFAVTWDETTGEISTYYDGVRASTMTVPTPMSDIDDVNVWLGRSNWTGDENLQGEFDEFRVYDRVLTPAELVLNGQLGPDSTLGLPLAVRLDTTNTVQVGQNIQPTVIGDFTVASNVNLSFSGCALITSSNPSVLSNDASGVLHALSEGTADVSAIFSGFTNTVTVTVTAGTAPQPLLSIEKTAGGFRVSFVGVEGTTYRIERSTTLEAGSWETVSTQTAPPGGAIEFEDLAAPGTQAFYRVVTP